MGGPSLDCSMGTWTPVVEQHPSRSSKSMVDPGRFEACGELCPRPDRDPADDDGKEEDLVLVAVLVGNEGVAEETLV